MTLTIMVKFECDVMSPMREQEIKRLIAELKEDVESYGGTVTKASLSASRDSQKDAR